jgi:hypothetical protein
MSYPYVSPSFPRVLSYCCQRLAGVSCNTRSLVALGNEQALPGDTVSFTLPENALVDLRTVLLKLVNLTTTSTTNTATNWAVAPKHYETLIDQITISVNGQVLSQTPNGYGFLWKLLADYGLGSDRAASRSVNQGQVMACYADAAAELAQANVAANTYMNNRSGIITNFLGWLGTASPPVIYTGCLGSIRIDVRFAPPSVLYSGSTNVTAVTPTYSIGRVGLTLRTYDMPALYYDLLAKRLSDSPLEVPFTNVLMTQGPAGTASQRLTLNVSASSMDMVLGTFTRADASTALATAAGNRAPYARTSYYFQRGALAAATFGTSQFSINNVLLGSPATGQDVWGDCLTSLGLLDAVGGTDQYLNSEASWLSDFFVAPLQLNLTTETGDRLLSGTDASGTQVQISWATTGTAANVVPVLYVVCKSVLKIGANRQWSVEA